ncbi:MAG: hypothetical protein HYU65_00970, partial [Armatimonadetes bacterium]|nr:hypothetical protein [Armatimonadota bacterium]
MRTGVGRTRLSHDRWVARAEIELGLVPVVRAAAELDVVYRGRATHGIGRDMMELEEAPLSTAAAVAAREGAAPAVSEPHRSLDLGRDVSRAGDKAAASAGVVRGGKLLLGEVLEQRRQRSIEDRRRIPIRDLMAQEVLREPELLVRFGAHRELHLIALGRQRDDS